MGRDSPANDPARDSLLGATPVKPQPTTVTDSLAIQVLASVVAGVLFGWALHKAGVFDIEVIRNQFVFRDMTMLKIFLTGSASSVLAYSLLGETSLRRSIDASSMGYRTCNVGVPSTLVGAALLGAGMTISGSCPGTIYVQIGALMGKSAYTFAGLMLGSLLYGLLQPALAPFQRWKPTADGRHTIYEMLGTSRYATGLAVAGAMMACVVVLEVVQPSPLGGLTTPRWHPVLSGLFIGALQVPLALVLNKSAGTSSTYVTFAANLLRPVFGGASWWPFFESKRTGIRNWWQVLYGAGAVLGSLAVVLVSNEPAYNPPAAAFAWWEGVLGGVLAAFGARLADGCTSGHGMSGMGHLVTRSLGAVAAMFAAGIAVAVVMYR